MVATLSCICSHDLYFSLIYFTLVRRMILSSVKFGPCMIRMVVPTDPQVPTVPTDLSGPSCSRHSEPFQNQCRQFIHVRSFEKFGRIYPNVQFGLDHSDHSVLQTHRFEVMSSGSTYILLDLMLSCLCGIAHNSVFLIFSNFILT